MSIMQTDSKNISCFTFTEDDQIIKCSLQSIENQGYNSLALVEMNFFGINHVYSLINISKVREFVKTISKVSNHDKFLSLTRVIGDSPIWEGINLKTKQISLSELSFTDWILLYQLNNIIDGMNTITEYDIQYDMQIGQYLDNPEIDFSKLNFSPNKDTNYKYILKFSNDLFVFSNKIDTDKFIGIFVYIPEFDCWQYLSKKKFDNLNHPNRVEIKYAITNSPRCFSKVAYSYCYSLSDIENLIRYSIYIPVDIYFKKEFDDMSSTVSQKAYDALEIVVEENKYTTSVLLTHDELGIESLDLQSGSNIIYMDKFWLLKLINNIICLKPY